jgi:carbonic anhydrase
LSVTDELIEANRNFASHFDFAGLAVQPRRKLAILACMDSRILFEMCMGVRLGDAHMIRNAGGIATEDAIRSLIVSHHLLGTEEFVIINHTDCGLLSKNEDELQAEMGRKMPGSPEKVLHFHAFDNLEENVREQVRKVKSHPWIPKHIPVRGFIYDVKTGRLQEVPENRP